MLVLRSRPVDSHAVCLSQHALISSPRCSWAGEIVEPQRSFWPEWITSCGLCHMCVCALFETVLYAGQTMCEQYEHISSTVDTTEDLLRGRRVLVATMD